MKLFHSGKVIFTQRMDYIEGHGEWRDNIDQRVSQFIEQLGGLPIAMPNHLEKSNDYIQSIQPAYIILTGGNAISSRLYEKAGHYEKTYTRDLTEESLLRYAVKYDIPVLGICRGYQMINVFFGGTLIDCEGHVATRHSVKFTNENKIYNVNSFHGQSITENELSKELTPLAVTECGLIEAAIHNEHPIIGIQWHPEREQQLQEVDLTILRIWLGETTE